MKKTPKKNLGKGLSALLGNSPVPTLVDKRLTSNGLLPSSGQISAIENQSSLGKL